jgi:hypothetical protein
LRLAMRICPESLRREFEDTFVDGEEEPVTG